MSEQKLKQGRTEEELDLQKERLEIEKRQRRAIGHLRATGNESKEDSDGYMKGHWQVKDKVGNKHYFHKMKMDEETGTATFRSDGFFGDGDPKTFNLEDIDFE